MQYPRQLIEHENFRRVRWLAAWALALPLASLSHASAVSLDRAAQLIDSHQAASAYEELAPQEGARAGDPRFDYLLGVAALDSGHITRAIFALERLLTTHPDDHPARAELARAYMAAGEIENARAELERVRGTDMPDDAAAAIDRVLGLLDQVAPSDKPSFTGYLELSGGWDSNVNSATNAGQFAIPAFGGLLFNVAPGSRRTSDTFAAAAAGGSVQLPLSAGWSLFGGIDGSGVFNSTAHEMDTSFAIGSVGVSHVGARHTQTLAIQSNEAWISSSPYRTANGASLQWQMQLDEVSQASLFTQWARLNYAGQNERNADRSVLGTAYARRFDALGTLAYASLYVAEERSRNDAFSYYGHHATGLRIGGEQKLGANTVLFAEWQYESRRYRDREPLFDVSRIDHQNDLLAGIRIKLADQWQLVPQVRYTDAASNVVLYDYGRTVIQINLRREFK